MDISFCVDGQIGAVVGPNGEVMPIVSTQSGSMQARVADGETFVIGGISGSSRETVPPLAEGPVMTGGLLRQRLASERDTELLIFITPRVIGGTSPEALPFAGVITGEIRYGEQWLWDSIALEYADATEVARTFGGLVFRDGEATSLPAPKQHPSPPGVERSSPSAAGYVTVPEGMDPPVAIVQHNTLLVHGTPEAIARFREVVSFFDKPTKLIEIEATFVEVAIQEGKVCGIDWFVANGSAEFYNLGFKPGGGVNVGRFRRGRFESELKALLDEGRAEIINAPRVTTRNNQTATVEFTREIPCFHAMVGDDDHGRREVASQSETVAITQSLAVTPRILEDNSVVLFLEPKVQNQVGTWTGPNGEVLPMIETQSAIVQVRVPAGETIVIGGLTRTTEVVNPGHILLPEEPVEAEQSQDTERVQTELLIFVTARILREFPQ
jgi:type II secretory pathway component GspD/PulD (secretin)